MYTVTEISVFFTYLVYGLCASKLGWEEFEYTSEEISFL